MNDEKKPLDDEYMRSAEDTIKLFKWFVDKGYPNSIATHLVIATYLDRWFCDIEFAIRSGLDK